MPEFLRLTGDGSPYLLGHARPELNSVGRPGTLRALPMKKATVVKNYYLLPCLLLVLNVANNLIAYKAEVVDDPFLRTAAVVVAVLFGGWFVAFVIAPGLEKLVHALHRTSRTSAGTIGEAVFLIALGAGVFWMYYVMTEHGVASLLPAVWRNPGLH